MNQILKKLSCSLLVVLALNGCHPKSEHSQSDIFIYKDSYVGDNTAVINIVNQTMASDKLKDIELKTEGKPYGIILNYDSFGSEYDYKKVIIYNATYLFTLIQNADWVIFNVDNQEYKVTDKELQNWYQEDFREITDEQELRRLIQRNWDDKNKVDQLF